ncbi:MAG: tRNA glutamyl-Q(34) synthetase GluQRS [Phycisphaera sp.]|nr:MAG: tRNA glutamyl-Q(34) synthetase GluQRS [Phycisphaera sp.]
MSAQPPEITRLAPSPTGALHLGNARTFVVNWILARRHGWCVVMRIEDLDGPRVKPEAIDQTLETLRWLGLDWDGGPSIQSHDLEPHARAMDALARAALAYPCELTRTEIAAAASAPHAGDAAPAAVTRPARLEASRFENRETNWRFATPATPVTIDDAFSGSTTPNLSEDAGDFVIWTKRGMPAYQLAVVVDDARQGVTQVVRGDDLLPSAARQVLLYQALGFSPLPTYTHLPLVLGPDGRRLAKRHGDSRLTTYQRHGVPVERILGLLAHWSLRGQPRIPIELAEFTSRLDVDTMPRGPARFTPEDDAWLLGRS